MMKMVAFDLPVDFNRDATADNVRDFFNHQLEHYLRMSGSNRTDLKSPQLSFAGGGSPIGNGAENTMLNGIIAEKVCWAVGMAIKNSSHRVSQPSYTILTKCYLDDDVKDWQVATLCGFAKSRFQQVKKEALCEFAERFDYWQNQAGLMGDEHINLIVF